MPPAMVQVELEAEPVQVLALALDQALVRVMVAKAWQVLQVLGVAW